MFCFLQAGPGSSVRGQRGRCCRCRLCRASAASLIAEWPAGESLGAPPSKGSPYPTPPSALPTTGLPAFVPPPPKKDLGNALPLRRSSKARASPLPKRSQQSSEQATGAALASFFLSMISEGHHDLDQQSRVSSGAAGDRSPCAGRRPARAPAFSRSQSAQGDGAPPGSTSSPKPSEGRRRRPVRCFAGFFGLRLEPLSSRAEEEL